MTDSARRRRLRSGVSAAAIAALALAEASTALAGPQGGQIRGGAGTISQDGGVTRIRQTSDRLVIDWDSFDIEAGETVRFRQPGRDAVALNRVTGEAPTAISGALEANGNVWIVNRSGVSFNRGARVDVGGLLATTADISDEDFLAGRNRFDRPGQPRAMVTNEGAITVSEAGLAALVGPRAANRGRIEATLGTVVIGGAERFALDLAGDGMFAFALDGAALSAAGGPLAENAGEIAAAGGRVLISAEAAADLVDAAVSVSGRVEAGTGSIRIEAGAGLARIDGRLTALGAVAGETGGTVEATGGGVIVGGGATLDASGDAGGGAVRVGGMLRGGEGLAPARRVRVAAGATLRASATGAAGAGGEAIVWAEEATWFSGFLEARGGAAAGDGGFAEVSGKGWLDYRGTADLSAPGGAAGTLLLDPANIVVAAAGAALPGDGTVAFGDAGLDAPADPTTSTISAASLAAGPANVSLQATNNITVNAAVAAAGRNLTFEAGNNIVLNQQVMTQSVNFSAGRNLTVGADVTTVAGLTLRADAAVNGAAANGVGTLDLGAAALDGGVVTLASAGALELTFIDAASLSVTAGGAVTQAVSATLNVTGATSVRAAGEIVRLDDEGNDFGDAVSVTGGAVTLVAAGALELGAVDAASLSVTAGGAVTQAASTILQVTGLTEVEAIGRTVTLGEANDFGTSVNLTGSAVTIRDDGDLSLGTVTATLSASVTAANAGSRGTFGGGLTALSFNDTEGGMALGGFTLTGGALETLSAGGDVRLDDDRNAFGGAVSVATADRAATFAAAGALRFGPVTAARLDVEAGGDIGQTAALAISGAAAFEADGAISLMEAANAFGGGLSLDGAGSAEAAAAGNLRLDGLAVSGAGSTGAVTAAGALTVPAAISGVGAVTLTAGGRLDLTGRIVRGTDVALRSEGALALAEGSRLRGAGAVELSAGGALTLDGGIGDFASLTGTGAEGVRLGSDGSIRTAVGAVTLDSDGGEVAIDGRIVFGDGGRGGRRGAAATAGRGSLTMESDGELTIGGRLVDGVRRFRGGDDVLSGGADIRLIAAGDVIFASFVGREAPLGTVTVSAANLRVLLPDSEGGAPVRNHALSVERLVIERADAVETVADEATNRAFEGANEFFGISIADRDGLELPPEESAARPTTINLTGRLGTAATREVATALGSQPAEDDYRFNTCSFGSSGECSTNTTVTFRAEVETRAPDIFALEVERLADVYAPFGNEELWRTPQVLTADGTARREGQE